MTMEEVVNKFIGEMHADQEIYFTRGADTSWSEELAHTIEGCGPYGLGVEVIDFDEDGAFQVYYGIHYCDGPELDQVLLNEIAAKATKDHKRSPEDDLVDQALWRWCGPEDVPECPF